MMAINKLKSILLTTSCLSASTIAVVVPLWATNNIQTINLEQEASESAASVTVSSDPDHDRKINNLAIILSACIITISLTSFIIWVICFKKRQQSFKSKTFKYKR